MRTWLDWFAKGAKERYEAFCRSYPSLRLPRVTDDYEAMRALCECAVAMGACGVGQPAGVQDTLRAEHGIILHALLWPFLHASPSPDAPPWKRVQALAPSRNLVAWLAGADAPEDGGEAGRLLHGHCLYVDLPDGALLVGEHCVRVVMTLASDNDTVAVAMVLTRRGTNRTVAVLEWLLGVWDEPQGASRVPVDAREACRQAEQFLRLLVLYNSVAAPDRQGRVPYMPPAQMFSNPRRTRQNAKKYSMFRVTTLDAPREATTRPRVAHRISGEGHRLDVRVAVRPHFRWQACGPRWSERKLILIDGFWRGPENGRVRAPIVRLDAPHPRRRPQAGDRQPTACRRGAHGIRDVAPDPRGAGHPKLHPMKPTPVQEATSGSEATPDTHGTAEAVAAEIRTADAESGACS